MRAFALCLCLLLCAWAPAPVPRRPPPARPAVVLPGAYVVHWNGLKGSILFHADGTYLHVHGDSADPASCYHGVWWWDNPRRVLTLFDRHLGGPAFRCDVTLDANLEGSGPSEFPRGTTTLTLKRQP